MTEEKNIEINGKQYTFQFNDTFFAIIVFVSDSINCHWYFK